MDPELADVLPQELHTPDVPGLQPTTARQYIAAREVIFDAIARKADFGTVFQAALDSGYNLGFTVNERLEFERNALPNDPTFDPAAYLDRHHADMLPIEMQQYMFVNSSLEAKMLQERLRIVRQANELIARRLQD